MLVDEQKSATFSSVDEFREKKHEKVTHYDKCHI